MSDQSKPRPGGVIARWWSDRIAAEHGAARKARAELKRAFGPAEALAMGVAHELNARLGGANNEWDLRGRPEILALIVTTLAGVETSDRLPLSRKFGRQINEMRALSELRFQRIIRADDPWTLAVLLRRALPQAKRACNVATLGNDLFYWGDDVRSRWCFEYFGSQPPMRMESSDTTETTQTEDA